MAGKKKQYRKRVPSKKFGTNRLKNEESDLTVKFIQQDSSDTDSELEHFVRKMGGKCN